MASVIAALSFENKKGIGIYYDKDSIKTSFPNIFNNYQEVKTVRNRKKDILKIAIDSPAAAGAGTTQQKKISESLQSYFYLDTGKMLQSTLQILKIKFPSKYQLKNFLKKKLII